MAASRFFSNTAIQTALSGNISSGATSIGLVAVTGFPALPYTLALDFGGAAEELVNVTAAASTTLTVTRGYGGTSAQSHSIGAVVRHVYDATEAAAFRTHEGATAAVHGVTGTLVGTSDTQTLANKTLTAPAVNGGALSGTFTGNPTYSGSPVYSGTPSFTGGPLFQRAAAGNPALRASVAADTNDRLLVQADGTLAWGSGAAVGDTTLYREGAKQLSTTDTLLRVYRGLTTDSALSVRVTGDTVSRLNVGADGTMTWGPGGAAATDVNLYRQGAATLRTDQSLQVGGSLTVIGVGGALNARKTTDSQIFSNTTVADDAHLFITVVANAVYSLEGAFMISAAVAGTGGWKGSIVGPAGTTGYWSLVGPPSSSTTDPDQVRTVGTPIGAITRSYGVSTNAEVMVLPLQGMLETTAAGVVKLQWAQLNSAASGTTMKQYSWMRLTRVA